jgi:hypothetical protein
MTIPAAAAATTTLADDQFPLRTSVTTTPSPLNVSPSKSNPTKGSIDVLVSSDAFSSPDVYSLIITFKVADDWDLDAADILTPAWSSVSPYIGKDDKWTVSKPQPGTFTFTGGKKFAHNETLRVRLDNVPISTELGITNVVISVKATETASAVRSTHPLGKFPHEFKLTDFHADDPIVERGESTSIRWTVSGDNDVKYELYINGTDSGKPSSQIKPPLSTGPLFTTTVYKLVATYQVGADRLRHETATTVFVNNGDVTTERLTAKTATIAGLIPNCVQTLINLDKIKVKTGNRSWTASNWDGVGAGLIIGVLAIEQKDGTHDSLTLNFDSNYTESREIKVSSSSKDWAVQTFVIPMPAGRSFWISLSASGSERVYGDVQLTWISLTDNYTPPALEPEK